MELGQLIMIILAIIIFLLILLFVFNYPYSGIKKNIDRIGEIVDQ